MGQDEKEKLQEQIKEEEVKPTEGTSSPVLDKTIKADLQESMQDIKPLSSERLDEVSRQLKDDKREFVEGGYAVDGYFVADDSLSRNEATTAAKKYYAGKYGDYADNLAPTSKHDAFQWKGKQYTTQTGTIASAPRYSSLPAIVKTSDYANYDALRAEKARLEAEAASMRPANESTEVSETPAPSPTPEPVPAPAETPAREESTAAQETPAATANPVPETSAPAPAATSTEAPAEPVTPAAASVPETQEQAPVAETTPVSVATPAATTEQATVPTPAATAQTNPPAATTSAAGSSQPAPATETTDTTETTETTGTTETTTAATSPSDIYSETKKYLEEENEKQKQNIRDIYQNEIGGYDKLYEEAMKRKEALATMDKERSKKENAYRYITGVGDLMSGFANLVGTANYASNQDQAYQAPELVKRAEAARKERKLEMQKLNARLEEMRARKDALTTQRDTKLAELDAKLVSDVYKANMQKAQDERMVKIQGMKDELEAAKNEGRLAVEREKNAGKIAVAEVKAANALTNTRLRIQTSQGGRVKNATFYDENGQPKVLNVYSVEDVGAEVIKAVNANRASWSTEEQEEYNNAVTKATLAATYGGDGGEALEIFYEKMSQKPYVYEHFKRLVGGTTSRTTTTSTTTTSGGSSVDSALEGL